MQETVVAWDPVTIWHPAPWFVQVYFFYLLYALVRSAMRLTVCVKRIRSANAETPFPTVHAQLASLKRTVVIVILGGSFVGLYGVTNVLHIVAFEARHPAGVIAANLSEAIAPVAIGFFIALILYVAIACLESLVERRAAR